MFGNDLYRATKYSIYRRRFRQEARRRARPVERGTASLGTLVEPGRDFPREFLQHERSTKTLFACSDSVICKLCFRIKPAQHMHQCGICEKYFGMAGSLAKHIKLVHAVDAKEKEQRCNFCEKAFTQRSHLNRHVKTVHEGIKSHKCNICEKTFTEKHSLDDHTKTIHAEERFMYMQYL